MPTLDPNFVAVLASFRVSPAFAECVICGGTLSWHEDRDLALLLEPLLDHYATNHL